ncbi:MAG: hypothetical protein HWQ40_31515 [Nostoc sp. NMS9]|nr:hypothetical protein [Nostoc sp. NMS9]
MRYKNPWKLFSKIEDGMGVGCVIALVDVTLKSVEIKLRSPDLFESYN